MLKKKRIIFGGIVLAVIIVGMGAQSAITLWIGRELEVSLPLVVTVGLFVIVSTWNNVYAMFVNGIGRIRAQLYTAVIAMLLNIPLALFFTKYCGLGLSGVVLATCVCLLFAAVVLPIQVHRIIRSGEEAQ